LLTRWPGAHAAGMHDVELLHEALAALDSFSPEHAQVVELRFGLGLTVEEAARASGIAERTLKRRWRAARAWLLDYLAKHDGRTVSS
jgi:DNA-directed RNA polymerase specialized sigma24 family protein